MKHITNKIKNSVKKGIAGLALAGSLAFPSQTSAQMNGALEVLSGEKTTLTDTKLSLDLGKKVNVFGRNITSFDYESGKKNPFSLVDVSYNLSNGLGGVFETQFVKGMAPDPRLGLQFFKKKDDLSFYSIGTININGEPNFEGVAKLRYTPRINDKFNGLFQLENLANFNGEGLNFAVQRARVGLVRGNYEFGVGANITEVNSKGKIKNDYMLGGFLGFKF
ncbi:MAG: hypothetical protein AABW82_04975 [Nanoarchaeota archaeon]